MYFLVEELAKRKEEIKKSKGIGIDISKKAIDVAKKNSNNFN